MQMNYRPLGLRDTLDGCFSGSLGCASASTIITISCNPISCIMYHGTCNCLHIEATPWDSPHEVAAIREMAWLHNCYGNASLQSGITQVNLLFGLWWPSLNIYSRMACANLGLRFHTLWEGQQKTFHKGQNEFGASTLVISVLNKLRRCQMDPSHFEIEWWEGFTQKAL